MSKEFFDAVKAIEAEKGIPAEYLYEKISAAIIVAAKHDYNGKDIVHCDIDPEKQKIKVYVRKNVVDEIEDEDTDLTLEQAQLIRKSAKVGGTVDIPLKTKNFGRIVAQTAKHVIRQGIREAERGQMIEEFKSKNQELITAKVDRIDPDTGNVTLDMGKNSAVLPKTEQVPGEHFTVGENIKVFVVDVKEMGKGPRIMISLTCASALEAKRSLTTRLCRKLPSGAISAPLSHNSDSLSVNFSGKMQRIAEASTLSKTVQRENAPIFAATAKNDIERVKLSPIARLENEVKRLHKSDENAYAPIKKSAFSFVIPSAKTRHSDTINAKR